MTAEAQGASPLAHRASDLERIAARELTLLAQIDVRVDVREAPHAAPRVAANTWILEGEREWLWLGPDEWLVVGPAGSASTIESDLRTRLAAVHHSVVDVSASRAAVELSGPERLDTLAAGCGLDLHPRTWRAGTCAQVLLARVPVLLQERDGATRVFVRSSYAGYLVDWLLDAARPA